MYGIFEFYLLVVLEMFFFIKIKQFTSGCCNLITKRQTDRGGQTDREADRQTDR